MFSRFSEEAQKVLMNAKKEMQNLKHPYIGSEHLMLSLMKNSKDIGKKLSEFGITYSLFRDKLIEIVGIGNEENHWFLYTPLLKRVLETAILISKESSNGEVTSEQLLFAVLEEGEGIAIRILSKLDIDLEELQAFFSSKIVSKKRNGSRKKMIVEEYGLDLTEKALFDQIDPVVGREEELKRVMEILSRRGKNNPLLIGDAGVGKTAIVEELARLIVHNRVPQQLRNKRIISVSIASLVAGTKYRGEFEERITKMLKEIEGDDSLILFIDEIHTLIGAGGAEGAIDAANIFKPALARGKIRLIGATTTEEYKQSIEKDKAIDRRFQTIFVEEPSLEKVYDILAKLRPLYEEYHNVKVSDDILRKIIEFTDRYVYNRKQPDKAIDILDEVCAKVSLTADKNTKTLDLYQEKLTEIVDKKNQFIMKQKFEEASRLRLEEKVIHSEINLIELKRLKHKNYKIVKIEDVAQVISLKTKIPVYEIDSCKASYISALSKKLRGCIRGQDEAILELVNFTKRIKLGFRDSIKPASFLFVGPTGVGKTLLAKEYSNYLFGKDNFIRLDMSEYRDSSAIHKIIGSNPGYVGYDDCKNKLEEIKNKPHPVILLDEIEKAHPAVLNLFLQILDEGKIADSRGNVIHLEHNIIIMTSNLGFSNSELGFSNCSVNVKTKLKEFLSLELLNRIDNVIEFNRMDFNSICKIVKDKLKVVKQKFKERGITLHFSDQVLKDIVQLCEFSEFGARRVDKIMEEKIDNYVIDHILIGKNDISLQNVG
ncbi:MAG: ATP-dependent Clp protease ATP-binding subunit [bacterium]|nr:ATP-dependent Clp protease ATP-binding subunit [bacterium]